MPLEDLQKVRLKKLQNIKKLGVDPYPAKSNRKHSISDARKMMDKAVVVAGRLRSLRTMGKIAFADLEDESGKIQLFFSQEVLSGADFDFINNLDLGDFIEASGEVFKTQAGEVTVRVKKYSLLSKSIRPLPSDWYGLKDVEERLRKRYLDLLINPEVRELFKLKSKFWNGFRKYLVDKGFMEVETPILEQTPGGADARPFITHHNALDIDLYLRISPELSLKRLLVGGYEKVFEIGRIFRNEGIDDEHLQDYTQMEFYWSYADYNQLMDMVADLYQYVIKETFGTLKTKRQGHTIDWSGKWPRKDYTELLNEHWKVDIDKMDASDLYKLAEKLDVKVEPNLGKGRLLDYLYKKTVRPEIIQPIFLLNHPVEVEPLAKRLSDNPDKVQRMQILAMGSELGKGFSELNDPVDQRERFEEQMKLRKAGDEEAQMMDEDFVEALEYGMPPAAGFGISERLFSMLVDKPIRECVFFPTMKPEKKLKAKRFKKKAESQDFTKRMVVVLDKKVKSWQATNTIAHVSAYLGNKMAEPFDTGDYFETADGERIPRNSQFPIITFTADAKELHKLMTQLKESKLLYIGYTPEMIEFTDDAKLSESLKGKKHSEVEFLGVGIFGDNEELKKLTKNFILFK